MARERVLVTVKTYPTLSRKYGETVCTAGIREDGSWVRIYPVPFRRLGEAERYRKYDWIECDLHRRKADPRPESFTPADVSDLKPMGESARLTVGASDAACFLRVLESTTDLATSSRALGQTRFRWPSSSPRKSQISFGRVRIESGIPRNSKRCVLCTAS